MNQRIPNKILPKDALDLSTKWASPRDVGDVVKKGIFYEDLTFTPTSLRFNTYLTYYLAGLCPPTDLPVYVDKTSDDIKEWFNLNYFRLANGGVAHLGNEMNLMPASMFDTAKVRVCIVRCSTYETLDGSFGQYIISEFMEEYGGGKIFLDICYRPEDEDYGKYANDGIPLMFGSASKRPLTDFDIIILSTSYPIERLNIPYMLKHSGIPIYRWMRHNKNLPYYKCPVVVVAGLGAVSMEPYLADNPIHGVGQNAIVDCILNGEGEMMDLKFCQAYLNKVVEGNMDKTEFLASLSNELHPGFYDPTRVLFEYADKEHVEIDHNGVELSRTTYTGGGPIKRISFIDEVNKELHVIAGPESDEFQELEATNLEWLKIIHGATPQELAQIRAKYDIKAPPRIQVQGDTSGRDAAFNPANIIDIKRVD